MKNDIYYLSSKTMSMLKQRARVLKRNTSMSHTEALEFVAIDVGMPHWKAVTEAAARYQSFEQAMRVGLVVAFDPSESPDSTTTPGSLRQWEPGLDHCLLEELRNWWAALPAEYEDDSERRPNREILSTEEIDAACEDLFGALHVFILPKIPLSMTLAQILEKLVYPDTFFAPWFVWLRGRFHPL